MDLLPYFNILELPPEASLEEVRQAYKDLVNVWHPDRFVHIPRLKERAEKKLREINAAYEVLRSELHTNRKTGCEKLPYRTRCAQTARNDNPDPGRVRRATPTKKPERDATEVAVELGSRVVLTACYSVYKVFQRAVSELAAKAERDASLEEQRENHGN